ncbi:MAG: T9SS type A sorting domain-containing protein, partial [Bacteroidota bacterium]
VFFSSSSGSDAIVDANGNLHIATLVQCGFTKNQDSLLYNFLYEPRVIWDVYTTPTGWNAVIIDTILTIPVDMIHAIPGANWDHRLQISKTPDENTMIYVWTDSDPAFFDMVLAPDIFSRGRLINSLTTLPLECNLTKGTAYDGANYWLHVADKTNIEYGECILYPLYMTTTTHGATSSDPCTHYFLNDFKSAYTCWGGIEDISNEQISTFIFPNPFHETTTINFTLEKASPLSIEITDILGKQMMKIDKGILPEGSHNITVDCSGFSPGVYLYTVKAGELWGTGKMIIE